MEEAKEWEAEFKLNGKEGSASFDLAGKWLETETEIEKAEVQVTKDGKLKVNDESKEKKEKD